MKVPSLRFKSTSTRRSASSSFLAQNEACLTPSSKALRESSRESEPPSRRRTTSSSFFRDVSNFSAAMANPRVKRRYYTDMRHPSSFRLLDRLHHSDRLAAMEAEPQTVPH